MTVGIYGAEQSKEYPVKFKEGGDESRRLVKKDITPQVPPPHQSPEVPVKRSHLFPWLIDKEVVNKVCPETHVGNQNHFLFHQYLGIVPIPVQEIGIFPVAGYDHYFIGR